MNSLNIFVFGYLRLLFYPKNLCALYAYDQIHILHSPLNPIFIISLLITILFFVLIWRLYKSSDKSYLGLIFFFGNIIFFLHIIFVFGGIMAERFLYFASIGFFLTFVNLIYNFKKISKSIIISIFIFIILMLGIRTYQRNFDWESNYTLFRKDAREHPDNAVLQFYLANEYFWREDFENVIIYSQKAIEIYPDFHRARHKKGLAHANLGEYEKAIKQYKYILSKDHTGLNGIIWRELGNVYYNLNLLNEAKSAYLKYLTFDSKNVRIRLKLAETYTALKKYESAIEQYTYLLQRKKLVDVEKVLIFAGLGEATYKKGDINLAMDFYQKALSIDPNYKPAKLALESIEQVHENNYINK